MSMQTPGFTRSSLGLQSINTTSSPNLFLAASTAMARKASLNALTAGQAGQAGQTGNSSNSTPVVSKMVGGDGREIDVGDIVDVPGAMHGFVKFVGPVKGKKGVFAGVELSQEYAARGKNDGDVDGIRYFTTSVAGSGIFLPLHRATRRDSLNSVSDTFVLTPTTPASPVQTTHSKFSQSVGPGARPPSPLFKPKSRQSLPRPESPLRKPPSLAPTTGRPSFGGGGTAILSRSQIGAPRFAPSPVPKSAVKPKQIVQGSRPYSRNSSRVGSQPSVDGQGHSTPIGRARSSDGSGVGSTSAASSGSGFTPLARRSTDDGQEEIGRLRKKLDDRDRQLKDQATSLAEMESSLTELQTLIPLDGVMQGRSRNGMYEDSDSAQLRAVIREKNDKISMLTAEFDAHRADFRSTIDTLEMASTETERVYEKRVEELLQEVKELQDRGDDVESVARQLKSLEDLVQELEEGLEDARRGEAEAREEVEFLRGEVERTRAELRQEREKAAEALKKNAGPVAAVVESPRDSRDIEQRDDEIRGLKAIIHSLSSGPDVAEVNSRSPTQRNDSASSTAAATAAESEEQNRMQSAIERLEREKKELQGLVERKGYREEELERELERLQHIEQRASVISNGYSDRTATQEKRSSTRDSRGTIVSWRGSSHHKNEVKPLAPMVESDTASSVGGASSAALWCEICETGGHDILTCSNIDGNGNGNIKDESKVDTPMASRTNTLSPQRKGLTSPGSSSENSDKPRPLAMPVKKPSFSLLPGAAPSAPLPTPLTTSHMVTAAEGLTAGKDGSKPDPNKWCAICERDGHDSINCSFDDEF